MEMDYHGVFFRTLDQWGPTRFVLSIYGPVWNQLMRRRSFFADFVYAILSKFHAQEKLPSMHVQFFPVYVLTCGAQESLPSLSFDPRPNSHRSHASLLRRHDLYDEF